MNIPTTLPFVSKVASSYVKVTQGLQNYGANIASRVAKGQSDRALPGGKVDNYKAINPFPNPLKASSYRKP